MKNECLINLKIPAEVDAALKSMAEAEYIPKSIKIRAILRAAVQEHLVKGDVSQWPGQ